MIKYPKKIEGKCLAFAEEFRSPFPSSSRYLAEITLDEIRKCHPEEKGWIEFDSEIIESWDGFHAVRYHALYR